MSDSCFLEMYWGLFTVLAILLIVVGAIIEVRSTFRKKEGEKDE